MLSTTLFLRYFCAMAAMSAMAATFVIAAKAPNPSERACDGLVEVATKRAGMDSRLRGNDGGVVCKGLCRIGHQKKHLAPHLKPQLKPHLTP
jgi:hypothetical protein